MLNRLIKSTATASGPVMMRIALNNVVTHIKLPDNETKRREIIETWSARIKVLNGKIELFLLTDSFFRRVRRTHKRWKSGITVLPYKSNKRRRRQHPRAQARPESEQN
jgi:hypothetical protein